MAAQEPTLAALPNPLARYFLATRPAFLTITLAGCLLGFASAGTHGFAWPTALVTLLFALVAHAGVNVINDYYDAENGSDDANTERLFPFTGGSRFIQNGVLSRRATATFGFALLAAVVPAGLWLAAQSGWGLIGIGLVGLFLGWAYSAEPFRLNGRGLGEACVAAGFALIVIGTDYVQRGDFALTPLWVAVPYALLVTDILYINQFPDRRADALAGKRHWVVRLAPHQAAWGYGVIALLAYVWLTTCIATGVLPIAAALGLLTLPLSLMAQRELWRFADAPQQLAPAIRYTLLAAHLHALLLALALVLAGGVPA